MKKSFVLYTDIYDSIKDFSLEEKGELLDAIFNSQINPDNPQGFQSVAAKTAFSFIKKTLDRDNEKWERIVERNKKNIKKRYDKLPKPTKSTTGKTGIPEALDSDSDSDSDINKIHKSNSFLLNIPRSDLEELSQKFSKTPDQIVKAGEQANDWLLANGQKKKNYKAYLRSWLRNDYSNKNEPLTKGEAYINAKDIIPNQ